MDESICLIIPPSIFLLDERVFPSLGVLKVAAALERDGVYVEVLDLSGVENYTHALEDHVRQSTVNWFGITSTTPQMPAARQILETIKDVRKDARVMIGGPHPTLVAAAAKRERRMRAPGRACRALDQLLLMFDCVVAGDGEYAVKLAMQGVAQLVDADDPKGALFMTEEMYDRTPPPARHLIDLHSYRYHIEGHRATSLIAQLGCPFNCSFSLTGDSLIFVDAGFERVANLSHKVGVARACVHGGNVMDHELDVQVATAEGVRRATKVVYEGIRPIYEVRVEGGMIIRGTSEHPMLALDENRNVVWKTIKDLRDGDFLVVRSPNRSSVTNYVKLDPPVYLPKIPPGGFQRNEHKLPDVLDEDLAWLIGYIIGDGSIPSDGRPAVHVVLCDEYADKIKLIVRDKFDLEVGDNKASNTDAIRHGWIHSRLVREFLMQSIGLGCRDDKLTVPLPIRHSPDSVIRSFLDGLFAADGYEPKNSSQHYVTTVSLKFAEEVAMLILMTDRVPTLVRVEAKDGDLSDRGCYRVGWLNNDRIPTKMALYRSHKSGTWHWRTARNKKTFLGVRRRTLRESGLRHHLDRPGWHYVRVTSVTPGIAQPVYDLEVPGEHCFVANGFVAHNCGGRDSPMLRRIRTRGKEGILSEIRSIHEIYGYTGFMFYDDELNVSKSMVELMDGIAAMQQEIGAEFRLRGFIKSELFNERQAEAMYRAGFRWILVGFESGSPRILENIQKKATVEDNTRCLQIARKHGLKVKALMSLGHAGESHETIEETKQWVLSVKPDDFDATVITTYPGSPYYDHAVETKSGIWTYTAPKSGDKLHAYELDYSQVADYYKGDPNGGYQAYIYTDHLSAQDLVELRDSFEYQIRKQLDIPFNPGAPSIRYEHSMGSGGRLPDNILRRTHDG
jgi:radical SAM superfamily enzyme YgiQ (UPF0313 family)/intein/homing endonuclease